MSIVQKEEKSEIVNKEEPGDHIPAPESDEQLSISSVRGPARRKSVGSISSLDALLANAESIQKERKDMKISWDLSTINKIWQDYMEKVDTASTKNALGSAKITLKGDKEVVIVTPNKINTETIKKEMNLIEQIRDNYPDRILVFTIYDDFDQFPELTKVEKIKKTKTNQEKLDLLVGKNPKVADFISRFNLKVDK